MTQHDDPLIQGMPLSKWERIMDDIARRPQGTLRGIRVDDDRDIMHAEYLENPFLGIHHSGPRTGARITLVDLGWSVETVGAQEE